MDEREVYEVEFNDYNGYLMFDETFKDEELSQELVSKIQEMIQSHYCNAIHPYAMQMYIGEDDELVFVEMFDSMLPKYAYYAGGLGEEDPYSEDEDSFFMPYTVSKKELNWDNPWTLLNSSIEQTEWLQDWNMIVSLQNGKYFKNLAEMIKVLKECGIFKDVQKSFMNKDCSMGMKDLMNITNRIIDYTNNTIEENIDKLLDSVDSESVFDSNIMKEMARMSIATQVANNGGSSIHQLM